LVDFNEIVFCKYNDIAETKYQNYKCKLSVYFRLLVKAEIVIASDPDLSGERTNLKLKIASFRQVGIRNDLCSKGFNYE